MAVENLGKRSCPLTLADQLSLLDRLHSPTLRLKALGLMGYNHQKASEIHSIWSSPLGPMLLDLVQLPFFADLDPDTFTDWSSEYRSYTLLGILVRDIVAQQKQISTLRRTQDAFTMETIFGNRSVLALVDESLPTQGTYETIDMEMGHRIRNLFRVDSFDDFWVRATFRHTPETSLPKYSPFLFGNMVSPPKKPQRVLSLTRPRSLCHTISRSARIQAQLPISSIASIDCVLS